MPHGFPPPPPMAPAAVLLHVVLLLLALSAVATLFFRRQRRARWWDLTVLLGIVGVVTPAAGLGASVNPYYAPFLLGYMLFVWAICGAASMMTFRRLKAQRDPAAVPIGCLFVSLAGLGLVIVMFLPAVPSAREAARRAQCRNNLKNIGLAMENWYRQHGRFPDAAIAEQDQPPMSWRVAILPFMDNRRLYDQYDRSESWDSEENAPIARTHIDVLLCVSDMPKHDAQGRWFTSYTVPIGPRTAFPQGKGLSLDEMTDGTSHTLLVAEACGLDIPWAQPKDFDEATGPVAVNILGSTGKDSPGLLSSYHPHGANYALADGSVRFLSEDIDSTVLKAMLTPAGDDRIDADEFER